MNKEPFTGHLSARATYQLGEPILVTLELRNTSSEVYQLLTWGTPFEFEVSDFLTLERDGQVIPYDGILRMRLDPSEQDYVLLAPNQSLTKQVDISRSYAIDQPGAYAASLKLTLHDVFLISGYDKQPPRPRSSHEQHRVYAPGVQFEVVADGQPRLTYGEVIRREQRSIVGAGAPKPGVIGGTPSQQSEILVLHFLTQIYTMLSVRQLNLTESDNALYNEWFGAFDSGRYFFVTANYRRMNRVLNSEPVAYSFNGTDCRSSVAYTALGSRLVFLCPPFQNLPLFGAESKFRVLVHEWSHAITFTLDLAYGQGPCRRLAQTDPGAALINGDNYGYFSAELPQIGGQAINNRPDTTSAAPAACVFNNQIFLFWKANDPSNFIFFASSVDGETWSLGLPVNTVRDSTSSALAACVFSNQIYVFWQSNDGTNQILFAQSGDGQQWSVGQTINQLPDTISAGPAACVFNNQLYVFWKSNDPSNRILFAKSSDGQQWSVGQTINQLPDTTSAAPTACVFNNQLYVIWKANDPSNRIFFAKSSDGQQWSVGQTINQLPDSTSDAPNACVIDGQLFIFWKSNDPTNQILLAQSSDGQGWSTGRVISGVPDTTSAGPAACVFNGQAFVFFKANNPTNAILFL